MDCVKCGACCRSGPCQYGKWDHANEKCEFLTDENMCSHYDEIVVMPYSYFSPAFGAGCCQPLRHHFRDVPVKAEKEEANNRWEETHT